MQVLENTDRWMVAFFKEGHSVSVMDKPTENIYEFDNEQCERFLTLLHYVVGMSDRAASVHYMKSLNDSIEYVVQELTKKGH